MTDINKMITEEQIRLLIAENQKENNIWNTIRNYGGIIAIIAGAIFGYATLYNNVNNNSKEIERLNNEIVVSIDAIKSQLDDQSSRFELYLESLRNVSTGVDSDFDAIDERIDKVEDRVLILEETSKL